MTRELVILITEDGHILIHGEDMPDLEELEELIGQAGKPEVEEVIKNCRLCG